MKSAATSAISRTQLPPTATPTVCGLLKGAGLGSPPSPAPAPAVVDVVVGGVVGLPPELVEVVVDGPGVVLPVERVVALEETAVAPDRTVDVSVGLVEPLVDAVELESVLPDGLLELEEVLVEFDPRLYPVLLGSATDVL